MPRTIRRSASRQMAMVIGALAFLGAGETMGPAILQSDEHIPSARFEVLREFGGEAVLDRHTKLIWERNPSAAGLSWSSAPMHCRLRAIGGRSGWRLPSFLELMTLVQPSAQPNSASLRLPTGHPFRGVRADAYWTSTPLATDSGQAYSVDFLAGDISARSKNRVHPTWCVRAGVPPQDRKGSDVHPESV